MTAWGMGAEPANLTEVNFGFMGNLSIPKSSIALNGTTVSGGGSGATAQNLISAPYDALVQQTYEDDTALYWDFESGSPFVDPTSNACLVIGNTWSTEGYDRPSLRDNYTDALINNVADQCANTIVVLHNAGTRLVDNFVDHPNVTAIIFAHLPGQDSGRALVSLLYGKTNSSGCLPYTVARNESDYGAVLTPDVTLPPNRFERFPQSDFSEGVFTDYRHFDRYNITPRYEFGFGLSYTTFAYANLQVAKTTPTAASSQAYPTGSVAEGGKADLWDVLATVAVDVANMGGVDGKEVVQLYVGIPGDDTATVTFELTRRDLSVWDVVAQDWLLQQGEYNIYVGSSSRTLPLSGTLDMETEEVTITTRCAQKHYQS
jgi:beta-glucosidase